MIKIENDQHVRLASEIKTTQVFGTNESTREELSKRVYDVFAVLTQDAGLRAELAITSELTCFDIMSVIMNSDTNWDVKNINQYGKDWIYANPKSAADNASPSVVLSFDAFLRIEGTNKR